jgi:hypothetical protein
MSGQSKRPPVIGVGTQ